MEVCVIDLSPVFAFPSAIDIETIEVSEDTVLVHLYATLPTAPCPQCGTPGSRIHSRYQRTIADLAFGQRHLLLKLLVRKWICRESSCSQRIFAERFPGLVRQYARMTDRLVEALQAVGVTTNGADAARILSALGMPTTAKTIIRYVLRLPLPDEGSVQEVGIDEWAWKKGHQYGTILVNLAERQIVRLLADRSVETSKAWLRTHHTVNPFERVGYSVLVTWSFAYRLPGRRDAPGLAQGRERLYALVVGKRRPLRGRLCSPLRTMVKTGDPHCVTRSRQAFP